MKQYKTSVTLISPPSRSFNHYRPPIALLSLSGYLLKNKISTKIIDIVFPSIVRDKKFWSNIESHRKWIENQILKNYQINQSPYVGITCYTPEYEEVLLLANKIKLINKKVKIIIGGIHPTLYPNDFFSTPNSPVDYQVIGEGEETLLELINALSKHKSIKNIRGICFFSKNKITINPPRPTVDNLDNLYYPAYKLINMKYYTTASPYAIRGCFLRSFYLLATRGCPSSCTFCVAKKLRQFNGGGKCTRIRSAESLVKEIKLLKNTHHIDSFYFIDDLFTINKDNVINFCNILKEEKLNLIWGCSAKVSTLNETLLKSMSEAGCVQIDFGIERGSDKALLEVQKGINLSMINNIFKLCKKYNIRTFANFLINLPNETKKDLLDINNLIEKLSPDIVTLNIFCPYPGTEIYDSHSYKFSKSEYKELFNSADLINTYPTKYRFSLHKIDLNQWSNTYNKKYNHFFPVLKFHLSFKYFYILFKSKNKLDYLKQFKNLVFEFILQKF